MRREADDGGNEGQSTGVVRGLTRKLEFAISPSGCSLQGAKALRQFGFVDKQQAAAGGEQTSTLHRRKG